MVVKRGKRRAKPGEGIRWLRDNAFDLYRDSLHDCLEWPFGTTIPYPDSPPYGVVDLVINGKAKSIRAHRLVTMWRLGPPPPGYHASHMPYFCHNSLCVWAFHLEWKSPKDNMFDKRIDGTHRPQRKLQRPQIGDQLEIFES
jgi:hypothetical protein